MTSTAKSYYDLDDERLSPIFSFDDDAECWAQPLWSNAECPKRQEEENRIFEHDDMDLSTYDLYDSPVIQQQSPSPPPPARKNSDHVPIYTASSSFAPASSSSSSNVIYNGLTGGAFRYVFGDNYLPPLPPAEQKPEIQKFAQYINSRLKSSLDVHCIYTLVKVCGADVYTAMMALIYIDRLVVAHKTEVLTVYNAAKIFLGCLLIANKHEQDEFTSNSSIANSLVGLDAPTLNQIELSCWKALDYNTWVDPDQFKLLQAILC